MRLEGQVVTTYLDNSKQHVGKIGKFIQFSRNEDGANVALILLPDGSVYEADASRIKFSTEVALDFC